MNTRKPRTVVIALLQASFAIVLLSCDLAGRQVSPSAVPRIQEPATHQVVAGSPQPTQPQPLSSPDSRTPTSGAESTKSDTEPQLCDGWAVHLLSVESSQQGGWLNLKGQLALENTSANLDNPYVPGQIKEIFSWPSTLTMTTNEGYSYSQETSTFGLTHWVPPDFRYMSTLWTNASLEYRVAETSTGHRVLTPCGVLDFDNPESDLKFPTTLPDSAFLLMGTPIRLAQGELVLTGFQDYTMDDARNDPEFSGGFVDVTRVYYTFSNPDQGYGVEDQFIRAFTISSDGYLSSPEGNGFTLNAGPGQLVDGVVLFEIRENRKLVLIQETNYWIFNLD